MRYPRNWLFVVLPFVYVAIILGLATVQYSHKSDSFQQNMGELAVSGTKASGSRPAEIRVRAWGALLAFDAQHAVTADLASGKTVTLVPQSWKWKSGSLVVQFSGGVSVSFDQVGGSTKSLTMTPSHTDGVTAIRFPFLTDTGVTTSPAANLWWTVLTKGKVRVLASVDGGLDQLRSDHTIVLNAEKTGFRPFRLDPLVAGVSPALAWATLDGPADPQKAEKALLDYWDRAYAQWKRAPVFSSDLVEALGREAYQRGEYSDVGDRLLALRSAGTWGFDASPYLGNIVNLTIQKRRDVEAASSRSQLDWSHAGRLWLDARYYGPSGSADRVRDQLLHGDLPGDTASLLAFFRNLQDLERFQATDLAVSRLDDVARALLKMIIRRDGQDYVVTPDGYLDLRSGLILGRLYLTYAHRQAQDLFATVGARLVSSALSWADSGVVPELLVVQDGAVSQPEGKILPESLYQIVRPEPPLETEVSEWGPGAFIRTPAEVVEKTVTPAQASFTFRFPAGSAEHILITGVEPFDHITMHGIRWRTDPEFQSYTDGWAYSASTKTLWVKIKHRQDLEQLVIHTQADQ